ncbi:nodal modulator 1-like [Stylonychia lemnae]|uniref:Nodal modulator 1-like n=1 Tax=Stylonychia lemnae TaxID=5949 RepID=A0A077ZWN2_STYLE|nr:nodal modulator 1-like [Stylonychia lemnae]|eukprot:CDW74259.1 nodal modulator 1-like [Stylonychia lemnae]
MKAKILLSLATSLLTLSSVTSSEINCNAHIDLQSEESQVSFDKMYLDVYSQSGAKQEQSQCTPDGNCFVVVYNLDNFSVRMRGPQGSVFEPAEYVVDTKKGGNCDDLAFRLKGFSLKFGVKALNQQGKHVNGPKGLGVEITRMGKNSKVPFNVQQTDENGVVEFKDISIPDTYSLRIIPNEDLTLKQEQINCQFEWETGFKCEQDSFVISGFSVSGKILNYNDPMPNVSVYIHQGDQKIQEKAKDALKSVKTDPQGVYKFTDIQSGSYQVVAVYSENQSKFQVEPDTIKVVVDAELIQLEPFQVIGFSISGKAVNNKGEGISGVKIVIDGQQKALTNDKGLYKLDEITPGQYILEGFANHYIFDSMTINIQSNSRSIPNLIASDYHLCGKISVDNLEAGQSFSIAKRTIILVEKNKNERRTTTNENGDYCFEVKSGQYTITPAVSQEEKERGLKFNPADKQISIDGTPALNVNFGQTKVTIQGRVQCLEQEDKKCQNIKVHLHSQDKLLSSETVNDKGIFRFEKVLPGKYKVSVDVPEYCWKVDSYQVNAQDDQNREIIFEQVGYQMPYESTHSFDLFVKKGKGSQIDKKRIQKGKNHHLCFDQRGSYTLSPDTCYKFEQEKFTFDTSSQDNKVVSFKPTHIKVEGLVILKDESQMSQVKMLVLSAQDQSNIDELKLTKQTSTKYSFEYYSPVDKDLIIQPQIAGDASLLFYPTSKKITVGGECISNILFETKTGYTISGKIDPPTEGVLIKVLNKNSKKEIMETTSNGSGEYKVGPLYDDQQYEIEASKEDYIIKRDGTSYNFKSQKLSTLTVSIQDQNGEPLELVSLQLSAGKGFRQTGSTNAQGIHKFIGLFAGKFYVTAILKEYDFGSSSFAVDLKDGDQALKQLVGKRVQFSAFGQVSKISGLPLTEGRIIASCVDCERTEEAKVDQDGFFRVRGLIPNNKYHLTVVSDEIDRTVPSQLTIDVRQEDSKNHQFLAIMQSPFIEVSGSVEFEGEDQKAVFKEDPRAVVELYDPDNLDQPLRTWQLGLSRYFQFSQLPRKQYIVRVVPKRGASDKRYEQTVFQANLNGGFQNLLVPSKQKGKSNIQRTALVGPVLFILVVAGLFYQDTIKKYLGIDEESKRQQQRDQEKKSK